MSLATAVYEPKSRPIVSSTECEYLGENLAHGMFEHHSVLENSGHMISIHLKQLTRFEKSYSQFHCELVLYLFCSIKTAASPLFTVEGTI